MKKIIGIFGVVLMVLLAVSCASMSLPAPTPEEAKEYEDTLGEVLASAGFGGVFTVINGDDLEVGNVCIGTGVGDYDFYINRPCSINDLHGVGAFLLMCASMEELRRWENER